MTLAAWLPAAALKLGAPRTLAARLTPDALAAWLAGVWPDAAAPPPCGQDFIERARALGSLSADEITALAGPDLNTKAAAASVFGFLDFLRPLTPLVARYIAAIQPAPIPQDAPSAAALGAVHQVWAYHKAAGRQRQHPAAPLADAWIEANRPAARVDRWPWATAPRLTTTDKRGELPTIDAPPIDPARQAAALTLPGMAALTVTPPPEGAAPDPAYLPYLPGLAPAWAPDGVIPASWLHLMEGFARADRDPRQWQRALRLMIEIVSIPDPRERQRGTVRVELPIGGPDGAIRRLWPHDTGVAKHYPDLRRALGMVASAYLPTSRGGLGMFLPVQPARYLRRPDVLAFDVTYPSGGGGGASYDRAALRDYGPNSRLFRVYLAAVFALDARRLRERDGNGWRATLPLDDFVRLAYFPTRPPADMGSWRERVRVQLAALARDGVVEVAADPPRPGRGRTGRLTLWRPDRALPAPDGRES